MRVLLQSHERRRARSPAPRAGGRAHARPGARPTACMRARADQVELQSAARQAARPRSPRRCRSTRRRRRVVGRAIGRRAAPTAASLEFAPGAFGASTAINARRRSTTTCRASCRPSRPPSWPLEALKAQAVAARTYAITTAKSAGFDHYADTRSQVYGGVGRRAAVDQRGRRRHARADRHLQGPAGRHLLLLDLGRAHRERREHVARARAAAVAEVASRTSSTASRRATAGASS